MLHFSPVKLCKSLGIDCDEDVALVNFRDHLVKQHGSLEKFMSKTQLVQKFRWDRVSSTVAEAGFKLEPCYFVFNDEHIFCLILHTEVINGLLMCRAVTVSNDAATSSPAPFVKIQIVMGNEKVALSSFTWKGPAAKLCSNLHDRPSCFSLPVDQLTGKPISSGVH